VNIGISILIIASNIISKLVVLGCLLMVGLRVVGSSMVSWGRHMVSGGSVDYRGREIKAFIVASSVAEG